MHLRHWFALAVPFVLPAALLAQQPPPTGVATPSTEPPDLQTASYVDFGARGTIFGSGSDEARFRRYRDLRNGPTVDVFKYTNATDSRAFNARAEHVGYRDQRYSAQFTDFGKWTISFDWDQIPLLYSEDTATLFGSTSPGTLRLQDAIQSGLQNRTTTLSNVVGQARSFDLRHRRDVLNLKLNYRPTAHLDWSLAIRNTQKAGGQPWAGTFGFSDAVELAVPIDTRTTELGSALEWSNARGLVRLGYDGSFFRNNVGELMWDNPLRVSDSPTAWDPLESTCRHASLSIL